MAKITYQYYHGSIHIRISGDRIMSNIQKAQKHLDDLVVQYSNLYAPYAQGVLRTSAERNTVAGSGEVVWVQPYAHYQYMGKDMIGIKSKKHRAKKDEIKIYNGKKLRYHTRNTGPKWFETAKRIHGDTWVKEVKKTVGGD